jgi:hypothetical protein
MAENPEKTQFQVTKIKENIEHLSPKDKFEFVRKTIEHENTLTNYRTTWTLAFHGFLFTAFVNGIGLFEKLDFDWFAFLGQFGHFNPLSCGLILICLLGTFSALAAFFGLAVAEDQLEKTTEWWKEQQNAHFLSISIKQSTTKFKKFPPLYDVKATNFNFLKKIRQKIKSMQASSNFLVLAVIWILFGTLVLITPPPSHIPTTSTAITTNTPTINRVSVN